METYEKQKSSKSDDFEDFWHAVRDSNPPAFWSVAAELSSPETLCCHFVSLRKPCICNGFELF